MEKLTGAGKLSDDDARAIFEGRDPSPVAGPFVRLDGDAPVSITWPCGCKFTWGGRAGDWHHDGVGYPPCPVHG